MPSLLVSALAGEQPDLSEVSTVELRALLGELETVRARVDVLQVTAGAELQGRGVDERVVARDLRSAKAPNPRQRTAVMAALPSLVAASEAFAEGKIGVGHLSSLALCRSDFLRRSRCRRLRHVGEWPSCAFDRDHRQRRAAVDSRTARTSSVSGSSAPNSHREARKAIPVAHE